MLYRDPGAAHLEGVRAKAVNQTVGSRCAVVSEPPKQSTVCRVGHNEHVADGTTGGDHGAVVIVNQTALPSKIDNVMIDNIQISGTRATASSQVSLRPNGDNISRIQFKNFSITGGPSMLFKPGTVPATSYRTSQWTYNGGGVADRGTYAP